MTACVSTLSQLPFSEGPVDWSQVIAPCEPQKCAKLWPCPWNLSIGTEQAQLARPTVAVTAEGGRIAQGLTAYTIRKRSWHLITVKLIFLE